MHCAWDGMGTRRVDAVNEMLLAANALVSCVASAMRSSPV